MQKTEKEKAWLRTHSVRAVCCGLGSVIVGMTAISSALLLKDFILVGYIMLSMSIIMGWIAADIPSIFNYLEGKVAVKSRLIRTRLIYLFSIGINMTLSFLLEPSQVNSHFFLMLTGSFAFGLLAFTFFVRVSKGKDSFLLA